MDGEAANGEAGSGKEDLLTDMEAEQEAKVGIEPGQFTLVQALGCKRLIVEKSQISRHLALKLCKHV